MIVVVDTGVANRHSVSNALEFIGCEVVVSNDADQIEAAQRLILPGVGAFRKGMENLHERGLVDLLTTEVLHKKKPVLGICLGFQMMAETSYEDGEHRGLGWIPGVVRRIKNSDGELKIPHVGFNSVEVTKDCHLFHGLPKIVDFYFLHSYRLEIDASLVAGTCRYGEEFPAAVARDNIMGTQFHPEKSQSAGLAVLRNFVHGDWLAC